MTEDQQALLAQQARQVFASAQCWQAPPHWRCIEFISDLHLSSDTPATFDALAGYLQHCQADAVVVLGDLFEVWLGDDARHGAFEQSCVTLLHAASKQRALYFMVGNRDFLLGAAMLRDCGMQALPDPTCLRAFGARYVLSHGDLLCLDDVDYQAFRRLVRSAPWQQEFLARSLDERAALARHIRQESQSRQGAVQAAGQPWADADEAACLNLLQTAHANTLIHGHTHRPARHVLGAGTLVSAPAAVPAASACFAASAAAAESVALAAPERWVLSDWDGAAQPARAQVLRLTAAGLQRLDLPSTACPD